MIKSTGLFTVVCSCAFFNPIVGYSVENQSDLSETATEDTSHYTDHEPILKEFQDYWMEIAQGPHHSPEFSQKLINIKEVYQPYLEVLESFPEAREFEIACSLIFVYEFQKYIFEELIYQNSLEKLNISLPEKVQCIQDQFFLYTAFLDMGEDKNQFIKNIPTNIYKITSTNLIIAPLVKNDLADLIFKVFYDFIDTISAEVQDSVIRDKFAHIRSIFQPYNNLINNYTQGEEITTTIGFIFAYEYGSLFTEETIGSCEQLRLLYKNLQPYINIIQQSPQEEPFRKHLIETYRWEALKVCSIIPNPMADDIIQELFEFCKNSSDFFSFELNPQNFEQRFTPYLNIIKSCFSIDSILLKFITITELYLKTSHFYFTSLDPNVLVACTCSIVDSRPLSYGYHKDNYTYLKVTNFHGYDNQIY